MRPKVLFTASTYSHLYQFHRPYLREFRRLGWQVDIACGGAPLEIPEAGRVIPLPFVKRMAAPANFQAARQLRRLIRSEGYDLLSVHTSLAAFFTRLAVRGLDSRPAVVNTAHGYLFDEQTPAVKRSLLQGAEALTAPVTDLLLTMNAWDTQFARTHHLGARVAEIPGVGVDVQHLTPQPDSRAVLRGEWGIAPEDFLLIYAAEFSRRKNQAMLIRALPSLPGHVRLLLPGSGDLREECMALARSLGVAERTFFPGQVRNMASWYAAADCAVSASRSEGLPFHIMEAMYLGLPVVASAVKGHVDLVRPGETGFLYPFNEEDAFSHQIQTLLQTPALAGQLGRTGAREAVQYSLSTVLPQVMAHYHALLPEKIPMPAAVSAE